MKSTKVKICCINSTEEANLAIKYGADCLGLVGPMPSGPGIISDDLIEKIAAQTPLEIQTFLLTSETDTEKIITHYQKTKTTTIQIVDVIEKGTYQDLRAALPDVKLVQVIHVLDEKTIEDALKVAEEVDYILLDSGNPNLAVKELGGTGRTHDWKISRQIVEQSKVPVFLAGGLKAENVQRAIEVVQPFGVDLCSGVRTNGHLDVNKLEQFMRAVGK